MDLNYRSVHQHACTQYFVLLLTALKIIICHSPAAVDAHIYEGGSPVESEPPQTLVLDHSTLEKTSRVVVSSVVRQSWWSTAGCTGEINSYFSNRLQFEYSCYTTAYTLTNTYVLSVMTLQFECSCYTTAYTLTNTYVLSVVTLQFECSCYTTAYTITNTYVLSFVTLQFECSRYTTAYTLTNTYVLSVVTLQFECSCYMTAYTLTNTYVLSVVTLVYHMVRLGILLLFTLRIKVCFFIRSTLVCSYPRRMRTLYVYLRCKTQKVFILG